MRLFSFLGTMCLITMPAFGQSWVLKADTLPDDLRGSPDCMTFDPQSNRLRVFNSIQNDGEYGGAHTATWDGSEWRQEADFEAISGLEGYQLGNVLYRFNPLRSEWECFLPTENDTYGFDMLLYTKRDGLWQRICPVISEQAFGDSALSFHPELGMSVFPVDGTLKGWDGSTLRDLGAAPHFSASTFDHTRSVMVFINGSEPDGAAGIREWDGETWRTIATPDGYSPALWQDLDQDGFREYLPHAIAWDANSGLCLRVTVEFDGYGGRGRLRTFAWNGIRFTQAATDFPFDDWDGYLINPVFDYYTGAMMMLWNGQLYELRSLLQPSTPLITSFACLQPSLRRGSNARFSIETDTTTDVAGIELWRDANGNGVWDASGDVLVGKAIRGANDQWTASIPTRSFPSGTQRIHAVAFEEFTGRSFARSTEVIIINSIPVLPGFSITARRVSEPIASKSITLQALRPTDIDGTVVRVKYFLDRDNSGASSLGDLEINPAEPPTNRVVVTAAALSYGFNTLIAHAVDNDGARSLPVRQRVYVNRPPVTTAFSATPSTISGTTATFTLSVTGTDVDGSITGAEFWWDVNNNGIIDSTVDRKIGTPRRVGTTNTWTSTQPRGTILTGQQRFIGRLIDNERVNSASTSPVTVTFN